MKRLTLFLTILTIGLFQIGCKIDDSQVVQQAGEMHGQIEPAVITDPRLAEYVQAIGDRIVQAAREEIESDEGLHRLAYKQNPEWMFENIQFHLVNSDTMNAFTTGGQHVYLYSELFETSETEDEFAAVVAHEYGHIIGRHVGKGMEKQYNLLAIAVGAGAAGYALGGDDGAQWAAIAGGGTLVAGQLILPGFTRKDEAQADEIGFRFYARAGYDPDKFGDFFQTMIDLGYERPAGMTDTHPPLRERVNAARERARSIGPDYRPFRRNNIVSQRDFDRLRAYSKSVGPSLPNDQSLQAAQLLLAAFPSCVAPMPQESQTRARKKLGELAQEQAAEHRH
jgi:beta-barrel assembly-enhancing protease